VSNALRRAAVKTVKPLVGETNWQRLRSRAGRPPARELTPRQQRRQRLQQMSLTELAEEFGTDKWGAHFYTPHYERHLVHLRDEKFTLLEIGIGGYAHQGKGGASLRMWKHFFRRAQILGLDIEDKSFVDAPRIKSYCGSQTDEAVLKQIVADAEDLRVVIDDGSHRPEHIRETFRVLFPMLPAGAIYAIEDTHTSYWPTWGGSTDLNDPTTTMALVKDLIDGLNYEEFLDDSYTPSYSDKHVVAVHCYHNLVIIEKGENNEGATRARNKARAAALRTGAMTD
jgi:demethylmacrocin O-methyltransferase